ncbi:uncharacterized protein LOC122544423 isoform X1 [Chiloscyllium plagiosum]|uniref:uncharacterized protein LOC122544423 isoform X1 n=1 Tax=Chiloscyllium plagiosum TaxID=36176 RepID=UPI001CB82655|nr:uncharacterized protein LOC122544423 isoform X1 [Chiloscyllium plagiosum]
MPFTPQVLVLLINLLWLLTAAGPGKSSIRQFPDSISVREGERIHIVCDFNVSSQAEMDLVVFKWSAGNGSIQTIISRSDEPYPSEFPGTEVQIRADLTQRETTLTVERATMDHSGLYVCHITILKPLAMQTDLQGNGTVVTVTAVKLRSSLMVYLLVIGVLPILCVAFFLLIRRVSQGKAMGTARASALGGQERGASQGNRDPQLLNLETIYSRLRLSLMRRPEEQPDRESQSTIYSRVQRLETNVCHATVSHAVQLAQPPLVVYPTPTPQPPFPPAPVSSKRGET